MSADEEGVPPKVETSETTPPLAQLADVEAGGGGGGGGGDTAVENIQVEPTAAADRRVVVVG
eukprot:COSAG02_NODE_11130_length_1786_cov_1.740368_1_plen_62_part_00